MGLAQLGTLDLKLIGPEGQEAIAKGKPEYAPKPVCWCGSGPVWARRQ